MIFNVILEHILTMQSSNEPFIAALDDTVIRKTGTHIPGVKYLRDPMGPPFYINLVRGQRFIQLSAAMTPKKDGPVRMIPITFEHAPIPKAPSLKATEKEKTAYKQLRAISRLSYRGAQSILSLRNRLDQYPVGKKRTLWVTVDGSYTNKTVLRSIPHNTVLIGRVRKDSKYHYPISGELTAKIGRTKKYGERAPTPEMLRKDNFTPWKKISIYASGKRHNIDIKSIGPILSRVAGYTTPLRMIIIRPLSYRPRKGSRLLYRQPAYLICTDPSIPLEQVVQAYVWRWEIEVNFRDEKQLLGLGQAQVRNPNSIETIPSFVAACYSLLLLSSTMAFGVNGKTTAVPPPKWRKNHKSRATTNDLLSQLKAEICGTGISYRNFSHFVKTKLPATKPEKFNLDLENAAIYAIN